VGEFAGHGYHVSEVDWSPTGERLVSAARDRTVRQWDLVEKENILTLTGHDGEVNAVSWHPAGELLATGSSDNRPRLWHKDRPELQEMMIGHTAAINDISWSPDGEMLATASEDESLIVWGQASGFEPLFVAGDHARPILDWWSSVAPVTRDKTTHGDWVFSVSWSSDGNYLASASYDGSAGIWDAEDGGPVQMLNHEEGWVRQTVWLPDEDELITVGEKGGIHHWNRTGELMQQKDLNGVELRSAAVSPDGDRLAVSTYENEVQIFTLPGLEKIDVSEPGEDLFLDLSWSPRENYLAGVGGSNEIIIWHFDDEEDLQKKARRSLSGYSDLPPRTLDWSPDMEYLAASAGGHLLIWPLFMEN